MRVYTIWFFLTRILPVFFSAKRLALLCMNPVSLAAYQQPGKIGD